MKKLESELKKKMEAVKITAQEVEMASKLTSELSKQGMDLETVLSLLKEFVHAK